MESAIYTAYQTDNQLLKKEIENYIDLIGRAQQPDGYLSTKQIIGERTGNGVSRMGDINDFEVYNFGHMFTAACVHKRITGKNNFLTIAAKPQIIWSIFTKKQSAPEKFRLPSARLIIWDLWKCIVPLAKSVI